jgi:hypothetical protein
MVTPRCSTSSESHPAFINAWATSFVVNVGWTATMRRTAFVMDCFSVALLPVEGRARRLCLRTSLIRVLFINPSFVQSIRIDIYISANLRFLLPKK